MIVAAAIFAAGASVVTATASFALVEERLALPTGTAREASFADLDGDGRADVVALGAGAVHVALQRAAGGFEGAALERLEIARALVGIADVDGAPGAEVVVADERGVRAFGVEGPAGARRIAAAARTLTADGLDFGPESNERAAFVRDLNGDGRADLLLPRRGRYEVRLQRAPGSFSEPRRIPIEVGRGASVGRAAPGERIAASFRVPALAVDDVNGDGREDVAVRDPGESRYYLQAPDGTFPAEPSFALRLRDFEDEGAGGEKGGILAQLENLRFTPSSIEEADLDGDKLRDFVVLTEGRVVAFRGTPSGVNAQSPWQVLKFSDAVGNVLLFPVNQDARPDLLAIRLDLPTLPRLVAGLFVGLTVDVRVLAFLTGEDGRLARKPDRKNTLHIEIPPILSIIRNPKQYSEKFERLKSIAWRGPPTALADLDGDGRKEAVVFDGATLRVRGHPPGSTAPDALDAPGGAGAGKVRLDFGRFRGSVEAGSVSSILDEFVFNPERSTYDIDSLPETIEKLVPLLAAIAEAPRRAIDALPVIAEAKLAEPPRSIEARDLDGDGRVDVVVRFEEGVGVLWSRPPLPGHHDPAGPRPN